MCESADLPRGETPTRMTHLFAARESDVVVMHGVSRDDVQAASVLVRTAAQRLAAKRSTHVSAGTNHGILLYATIAATQSTPGVPGGGRER